MTGYIKLKPNIDCKKESAHRNIQSSANLNEIPSSQEMKHLYPSKAIKRFLHRIAGLLRIPVPSGDTIEWTQD